MNVESTLEELRRDRNRWIAVSYDERKPETDVTRARILDALMKSGSEQDYELCRYVLEQEIACLEDQSTMSDAIRVAAVLVASHRNPADIWHIYRAKRANGSTLIGFQNDLLWLYGVDETLAFVEAADHPDRDELRELLMTDIADAKRRSEIAAWLQSLGPRLQHFDYDFDEF